MNNPYPVGTWMTTIRDKAARWGPGEWVNEPDLAVWDDPATGLPCFAARHPRNGAWGGYVGIPAEHPLNDVDYRDERVQLTAHGTGVTYSGYIGRTETVPLPDMWFFGFHCAAFCDIEPGRDARDIADGYGVFRIGIEEYRTLAYVQKECAALAEQLAKLA